MHWQFFGQCFHPGSGDDRRAACLPRHTGRQGIGKGQHLFGGSAFEMTDNKPGGEGVASSHRVATRDGVPIHPPGTLGRDEHGAVGGVGYCHQVQVMGVQDGLPPPDRFPV